MVFEEKIEYNDLVNSIQDGDDDKHEDMLTNGSNEAEPKNGYFFALLLMFLFCLLILELVESSFLFF